MNHLPSRLTFPYVKFQTPNNTTKYIKQLQAMLQILENQEMKYCQYLTGISIPKPTSRFY